MSTNSIIYGMLSDNLDHFIFKLNKVIVLEMFKNKQQLTLVIFLKEKVVYFTKHLPFDNCYRLFLINRNALQTYYPA